jgi:hypothetical protein
MDTTILEPEADELAADCSMEIRLLYSIAISVKRFTDLMVKLDIESNEELPSE